jgi:hypothetical protein
VFGMPDQLVVSESLEPHNTQPAPGRQAGRNVAFAVVLIVCLAITVVVLVTIVSPSAGAAGGCGGG